jgi:hypothetical protein
VFRKDEPGGRSSLWVAPTNRRTPPVRLSSESATESAPFFLADGDIAFLSVESNSNFLYREKADGTGRRKITAERIIDLVAVSPDGRWAMVGLPSSSPDTRNQTVAVSLDSGNFAPICSAYCDAIWDVSGKFLYVAPHFFSSSTYLLPTRPESGLPQIPPGGIARMEDLKAAKPVAELRSFITSPTGKVASGIGKQTYAYQKAQVRRNLYRIPVQ